MKAITIEQTGDPSVLKLVDLPAPEPRHETEVRVRIKAAGVNPLDTKLRGGQYPLTQFPAVLGCDGAGVIETIGSGVTRFNEGDEVLFFYGGVDGVPGSYAEYIVIDERFLVKKPENVGFIEAAAIPLVAITAWEALFDRAAVNEGQSVLIHAGAGGVGHVAIQLAKHAGLNVATTISTADKAAFVRDLGADFIINYREDDVVNAVMQWTGGNGVDAVMDNVGGKVIESSFRLLKPYGDLVTLLQPAPEADWTLARQRNLRLCFEVMLTPQAADLREYQIHQTWILEQCASLMTEGQLSAHISHTLSLADVQEAHRAIEKGSTTGKIVLDIG